MKIVSTNFLSFYNFITTYANVVSEKLYVLDSVFKIHRVLI